ncbi:hypothetical protein HNY73_007951 [Argiope bruennichi]|uniref:Uncharacterized protein n=2 Tax=Argiope bruennichi TaxID=94029 RepID=A0A8T0F508_ARGBR|nr:hypothetical protein HNY73_007951 [Argiope bruennichi]
MELLCTVLCCVLMPPLVLSQSGPSRGVVSRLGENLEQETRLEDRLVEVLNQQEIKENLDSVGHYLGLIGTGLSAGLGTILGNSEQVIKSLQRKK